MNQSEWDDRFRAVSAELERLAVAKAGENADANVTEQEGAPLEMLDDLEFLNLPEDNASGHSP